MLTKEGLAALTLGILCGVLYYNFYLAPRDEVLHAIIECMDDLHSKDEYDRCVQQEKQHSIIKP